jgi:hypothetical protein
LCLCFFLVKSFCACVSWGIFLFFFLVGWTSSGYSVWSQRTALFWEQFDCGFYWFHIRQWALFIQGMYEWSSNWLIHHNVLFATKTSPSSTFLLERS